MHPIPITVLPQPGRYTLADAMEQIDAAIRRERRPLPSHELDGVKLRQWAVAVLGAEAKHAVDDFWELAAKHGAALMFDHYKRAHEARPFRLSHEVRAAEAWNWLSDLQVHESFGPDLPGKKRPWSRWEIMNEEQRAEWRAHWWKLARGFVRRMKAYRAARAALVQPVMREAA